MELTKQEEINALKAQVEQLRIALEATRQPHMDFIPKLNKTAQQVLNATPGQCLAEIEAQAVASFTDWVLKKYRYNLAEYASDYTNQLRQAAKGE